jgi:hypothetical protein
MFNQSTLDLVDSRFSRLKVTGPSKLRVRGKTSSKRITVVRCICDCGNVVWVPPNQLKSGNTASCGCLGREKAHAASQAACTTHGLTKHPLYRIWAKMLSRCRNPNEKRYMRYGGRGISVCELWTSDFQSFYDWAVSHGYSDGLQIDREDNDGDYTPENCRWITQIENSKNRSSTILIAIWGETKCLKDWWRDSRCVVSEMTLRDRINSKWDPECAVTKISRTQKNNHIRTSFASDLKDLDPSIVDA